MTTSLAACYTTGAGQRQRAHIRAEHRSVSVQAAGELRSSRTLRMKRADITDDEVIEAIRSGGPGHGFKVLSERYPPKVVRAKYYLMVRRRQLDYGVSVESAWVEPPAPPTPRSRPSKI